MQKNYKWFIPAALIVVALIVYGMQGSTDMQPEEAAAYDQTQPDASPLGFTLKNVEGEQFDMSTLEGKVVLIDFWDTWCPPCRKGIPEFVEMKKEYAENENFEIVGIAFGRDGFDAVKKFAGEYEMNYPVLVPDDNQLREIMGVYGSISSIPTAFIIDRDGTIKYRQVGYAPASAFEEAIKPLLEG